MLPVAQAPLALGRPITAPRRQTKSGRAGMQPFSSANPSKAIAFCVALYAVAVGGTAQAQVAQAQVAEGQGTWTTKTPVPVGRTEVPGVAVNGKIHLLGGSAR